MTRWQKALIFLASAAVSSAFFINLCAWVFRCGCSSWWAGAADSCNIHMAGMKHCPWCTHYPALAYGLILAPQLAISFWPGTWFWLMRLAAAMVAFPVAGVIAAAVWGYATGYWR